MTLPRTDSITLDHIFDTRLRLCCVTLDGSWTVRHAPSPRYAHIRSSRDLSINGRHNKKGGHHRRIKSSGTVLLEERDSPQLLRCGGMRRDWSFEDLKHIRRAMEEKRINKGDECHN
ncbi:hypothetical protein Sjap_004429 [Stephania japonica]|uniref:Uncharacterized protein n=1 Tax=Stephania japonica TaxID=461633 RepID=A0AAP0K285_9MAGN